MQECRTYRLQDRLRAATALITVLAFVVTQTAAYALPTGGVVNGGSATINSSGNTMNINQASNKAIIDWSTFNIGSNQSVIFQQPSSAAIALNRIHDNSASQILGNLSANGQVWLLNSNGVMFGSGAQVNVAGMLATTAGISNSNFMAGNYVFDQAGNPNGSIINNGNISVADGGLVAMVAPTVINNGTITAKLGMVQMASGDTFTLDMYGDGLINLAASNAVTSQLVSNSGSIAASGGSVLLTTAAAQGIVNSLINMDGVIQADSVGSQNGVITLYAAGSNAVANNVASNKGQSTNISTVEVSGQISAQGVNTGETGGSITVTADHVAILTGANINASGDAGGGYIRIGGDFHGQGTTPTALATVVQSGANIYADAITTGNGGNVAVWSDNYTRFAGTIQARGGSQFGNGGYVETSGHQLLSATGIVDASAAHGQAGTWLLDPEDVVLTNSDSDENGGDGSASFTPGNGQATSDINVSHIEASLNAGTSVTVTTGGDSQSGPNGGSIEVAAPISATGNGTTLTVTGNLTLSSYNNIAIDSGASITLGGGTNLSSQTVAGGNLELRSDNQGNGAGSIYVGANISTNNGSIAMGGGSGAITGVVMNTTTGAVITPASGFAYGNASSGNVYGIMIDNVTVNAGTGNIVMNGQGGTSNGSNAFGVWITGGSANVKTTGASGGNIAISGIGGSSAYGDDIHGVELQSGQATSGSGNIAVNGTGGNTTSNASMNGVNIDNSGSISTTSGIITVFGTTGNGPGGPGAINGGVGLQSGSINSGSGGNIIITGVAGSGDWWNYGMLFKDSSGPVPSIGGGSANGNITLIADSIDAVSSPIITTTGNVIFDPYTSTTAIGINGGAGTEPLQITSGMLGAITANTVIIGKADNSDTGLITVAAGTDTSANNFGMTFNGSTAGVSLLGNFKTAGTLTFNNTAGVAIPAASTTIQSVSGAVNINDNITAAGAGTLDVKAGTDIVANNSTITSNSGALNVTLDADANDTNGSGAGGISLTSTTIDSNGGNITLGGGTSPTTMAAIGDNGSNFDGIYMQNATINGGSGGNITMNGGGPTGLGTSVFGVFLNNTQVYTTGIGTIEITGTGGGVSGGGNDDGVYLYINSSIYTQNGALAITGASGDTNGGGAGAGINMYYGANSIYTTGSGNITLTGIIGSGGGSGIATDSNGGWIQKIGGSQDTGTITFIADSISTDDNLTIQTSNDVTFKPYTASITIGVANDSETLNIDNGILGTITGESGITIGSTADMGAMTVSAYGSWTVPVSFASGNAGSITVAGAQAATGSGSFAFTGPTTLDANITTAGGNITFNSVVTLGANSVVNAEIGAITATSTVAAGSHNLTLTADSVSLGGNMTGTGALTVQPYSTGTNLHINDGTSSGWFLSSVELGFINNAIWSGVTIGNSSDSGATTIGAYSGWANPVSFLSGSSGSITVSGAQSSSGSFAFTGPTTLDNNITTANQAITFNSAVTLGANSTLNAGSGTLTFGSTVNGDENLIATAGTMSFGGALGGSTALNAVSLDSTNALTLPVVKANTLFAETGTGHDITTTGQITASGNNATGAAVVLDSGGDYVNSAGANVFDMTGGGRWLIYSANPANNTLDNLVLPSEVYSTTYAGDPPASVTQSGDVMFYSAAGSSSGGGSTSGGGSSGGSSGGGSGSSSGGSSGSSGSVINTPNSWLYLQLPQIENAGPCGAQGGGAGDDAVAQAVGNGGVEFDLSAPSSPCSGGGAISGVGGSASLQSDPNSGPATATLVSSNNQRNSPRNNIASTGSRRGGSRSRRDQDLQVPDLSDL